MKIYMVRATINDSIFESKPKTRKDLEDFLVLLDKLDIFYNVLKFNQNNLLWEDCTSTFIKG